MVLSWGVGSLCSTWGWWRGRKKKRVLVAWRSARGQVPTATREPRSHRVLTRRTPAAAIYKHRNTPHGQALGIPTHTNWKQARTCTQLNASTHPYKTSSSRACGLTWVLPFYRGILIQIDRIRWGSDSSATLLQIFPLILM